jgi:hypothetical protein
MKFVVAKKLELDFLGEGWNGAFINFSVPSLKEIMSQDLPSEDEVKADSKKYSEQMITFAQDHFLNGKGWNGNQLVDLVAGDIQELPMNVFVEATKLLMGALDPKS